MLCLNIFKPTRVTTGSKTLLEKIWCNTSVSTTSGEILSDISDHFPIFAQVKEPGNFSGNSDSYVTIKFRLKNFEQVLMFRSLLERFQYEVFCGIDSVDMLCETFLSDVVSRGKKVLDICKPYVNQEHKTLIEQNQRPERKYCKYPITLCAEYSCLRNSVKNLWKKRRICAIPTRLRLV